MCACVCVCENIYVFKLFFISFARELFVTLVVLKDQLFVFFKLLLYSFDLFKVFLNYCFPFSMSQMEKRFHSEAEGPQNGGRGWIAYAGFWGAEFSVIANLIYIFIFLP